MDNPLKKIQEIVSSSFLDILNMRDWSQEEKEEYLAKIFNIIENRILENILDGLNDEEKTEFGKLIDQDNKAAWEYLMKKVPSLGEIVILEVAKLKIELAK